MEYAAFDALTFDCYGTLIDWERGILAALQIDANPDEVLAAYAELESELEAGEYLRYREVVARCYDGLAERYGLPPDGRDAFAEAVGEWPPFPDSPDALARLKERFKLGVITNWDDDLFARSHARLGGGVHGGNTVQQVGAYKPSPRGFEEA